MPLAFLFSLLWCVDVSWAAGAGKSFYEARARSALQGLATNRNNTVFLLSLTNLPPAIHAKLGSIADAGQPYSDGCVGKPPRRRFIMATKDGQTYNVAFEQGGFVTMWHIWQFVVDTGGKVISDHEIVPDRQKGSASHGGSKTPR